MKPETYFTKPARATGSRRSATNSDLGALAVLPASLLTLLLLFFSSLSFSQDQAADAALGESITFIRNNRLFPVELETTIFKPPGEGPFPVVLINHGKALGNNRLQPRYRALPATREFLQRGYAVVVPMRQGFSKSGGAVVGDNCNIGGSGEAQADDIKAVVGWLEKQPWVDAQRMVMMGQSHGGLTTLAYAQDPHPGFRLFVNFAGGLRFIGGSCQWELALVDAFSRYGARTRVPSLWFYGENDSYFPPPVIRPAFEAYARGNPQAELVAFGRFGSDAHSMFGSYSGLSIWWAPVEQRLQAAGLPVAVVHSQFARAQTEMEAPPPTGFAAIDAVDRIPFVRESGRDAYRNFLSRDNPRAFAIAPNGAWGWASGGEDPLRRALHNCNRRGEGKCRLYAVDTDVVWPRD